MTDTQAGLDLSTPDLQNYIKVCLLSFSWFLNNCIIQSFSASPREPYFLQKQQHIWVILGRGLQMLFCLNENLFFRKAKERLQMYRRKSFLSEIKTLGAYAEVPVLARIPSGLAEAAEFATGPELHFEPSRKRSDVFGSGAKMPVNPAPGPQSLAAVQECWEACVWQLWSNWGIHEGLAGWGSTEPPISQEFSTAWAFPPGPKSSFCLGGFVRFWRSAWSSYVQFHYCRQRISMLPEALTITL